MLNRIFRFLPVILILLIAACEKMGVQPDPDNTPPKAYFYISPSSGDSTRSFLLVGSSSRDSEDMPDFLEFRWDFNNDSIWDTEFDFYPYLIKKFPIPGTYWVRMEVRDRHGLTDQEVAMVTSFGMNNDTSHTIDPRDGTSYKTVKLRGTWWMAENLNFGVLIRDTQMARDNGIFEKYCYQNDPSLKSSSGGYYTYYHWDEVINYDTINPQGLCPPGWRLPTREDWDSVRIPFLGRGISYLSSGGYSQLNLTKIGIHELKKPWEIMDECPCSNYWIYFTRDFEKDFYRRGYMPCPYVVGSSINTKLIRFVSDPIFRNGGALPVRCIKTDD